MALFSSRFALVSKELVMVGFGGTGCRLGTKGLDLGRRAGGLFYRKKSWPIYIQLVPNFDTENYENTEEES